MTRKYRNLITAAFVASLLLSASSLLIFPSLPSSFYGIVKFNGDNVPEGTLVEALIEDQVFATGYIEMYKGDSVYTLDVHGDDTDTTEHDGGIEGDIIHFRIGGLLAEEIATWHAGTNVSLDLTVISSSALNSPQSTPTAISTQTPIAFSTTVESSSAIIRKPAAIILAVILVSLIAGAVLYFRRKTINRNKR